MRLNKIKLAGFKSFVDPTSIVLETNLTGIVGPNGCGKSNIIDAVRWVMGEISAKQLRGESMTDVIFNGSEKRKPVSQASIELVFDNSDASLGGEYAKYSEIAVRREVSRDGLSDYYLNNTQCRRKDITDIFLGTGLGPRSYAIIEQGMISRLIEAKPDELRVYIEEAAGVSKYKERRRETENRIKHTKENLSRLNDIIVELDKQLRHLKYQANAAERYRKLKQEERQAKAELCAMQWQKLTNQLNQLAQTLQSQEVAFENLSIELQTVDSQVSAIKEEYIFANDAFNEVQGNFYRIGANIARLEEQIQNTNQRTQQLSADLTQLNQMLDETEGHQTADQNQAKQLEDEKSNCLIELEQSQKLVIAAQQDLALATQKMQSWQESWEQFNQGLSSSNQQLQIEQTRINHAEQMCRNEQQTLERLLQELNTINTDELTTKLATLEQNYLEKKAAQESAYLRLEQLQNQIVQQRQKVKLASENLQVYRHNLQNSRAKQTSLKTLQQIALGKDDNILGNWLRAQNLSNNSRLAQGIEVQSGWETAVETVLGSYLEAVCVDNLSNNLIELIKTLSHGKLILLDINTTANSGLISAPASNPQFTSLLSKVTSNWPIRELLQNIYACANLADALPLRPTLQPHESIITQDGVWLGLSWVRVIAADNPKAGVLRREQELKELAATIAQQQELTTNLEAELNQNQELLSQLEKQLQNEQLQLRSLTESYNQVHGELGKLKTHQDYILKRKEMLNEEIKTHQQTKTTAEQQLAITKQALADANSKKFASEEQKSVLLEQRQLLQNQLNLAQEYLAKKQQQGHDLELKVKLLQHQIDLLHQNAGRTTERLVTLRLQHENLQKAIIECNTPLAGYQTELAEQVASKLGIEGDLTAAKEKVLNIEAAIQTLEKRREFLHKEIEQSRNILETLRVERQGVQTQASSYLAQISELNFEIEALRSQIAAGANIEEWEQKLATLSTRIERLGPINLAAIEEYEKLLERKTYLDSQNQDLMGALDALDTAIRRIDQDAKTRFQETFDNINLKFRELFPQIFCGGKAGLELVTNEQQETGVVIYAQPPGKRNSSIHLLSGGEKALTAIAMIFSIFQLNPAPFCMLDEVDAPLDDVNVTRFCNLLTHMSSTIQFLFITHNKLSMETAKQLAGVTMQEPGVSRIVSVDIDKAAAMASS